MATRMLLTRYVWNPLRTNSERNPSSVGVKMKRISNVSTGLADRGEHHPSVGKQIDEGEHAPHRSQRQLHLDAAKPALHQRSAAAFLNRWRSSGELTTSTMTTKIQAIAAVRPMSKAEKPVL